MRLMLVAALVFAGGCNLSVPLEGLQAGGAGGAPSASSSVTVASSGGAPGIGGGGTAGDGGSVVAAGGSLGTYTAEVLADNPVLYWRLNETAGITAVDASGNNHHGTYKGTLQIGQPGAIAGDTDTAVGFNGGSVDAGGILDFAGDEPYTLEAWIRPTIIDGDYRHVFNKDAIDTDGRQQYGMFVRSSSGLCIERFVDSGAIQAITGAPPLDVYTHVVGTYDGTMMQLFVNAVLVDSATDARLAKQKDAPFLVGTKYIDTGPFIGDLDEVAVYDKALTQERVQAHYDAAR
jgi:hypothetical protein